MRPYCYRLSFNGLDGNGVTVGLILEKPQPTLLQPRVCKVLHPVTGVAVNLIIPLNQFRMVGVTHQYHVMLVEQRLRHGPVVVKVVSGVVPAASTAAGHGDGLAQTHTQGGVQQIVAVV